MSARHARKYQHAPTAILGFRRDGRPIFPIAGASDDGGDDGGNACGDDGGKGGDGGGKGDDGSKAGGDDGGSDDGAKGEPGEEGLTPEVKAILAKNRKAARDAENARKAAEAKVKEYEDRDKSEHQKAVERAEAAEKRAAELERQGWQQAAAAKAKLPLSMASRLMGSTKEEIESDAEAMAAEWKATRGTGDADGGVRKDKKSDVESLDVDGFVERFSKSKK